MKIDDKVKELFFLDRNGKYGILERLNKITTSDKETNILNLLGLKSELGYMFPGTKGQTYFNALFDFIYGYIPDLLTNFERIPDGLFYGYTGQINSLHIPNTIKRIGENAFFDSSIYEITFDEDCEIKLDRIAFNQCRVSKIVLPAGAYFNDTDGSDYVFSSNAYLKEVDLSKMTSETGYGPAIVGKKFIINASTFCDDANLERIYLPAPTGSFREEEKGYLFRNSCFYGCHNLKEIIIPFNIDTINTIEYDCDAFYNLNNRELEIKTNIASAKVKIVKKNSLVYELEWPEDSTLKCKKLEMR